MANLTPKAAWFLTAIEKLTDIPKLEIARELAFLAEYKAIAKKEIQVFRVVPSDRRNCLWLEGPIHGGELATLLNHSLPIETDATLLDRLRNQLIDDIWITHKSLAAFGLEKYSKRRLSPDGLDPIAPNYQLHLFNRMTNFCARRSGEWFDPIPTPCLEPLTLAEVERQSLAYRRIASNNYSLPKKAVMTEQVRYAPNFRVLVYGAKTFHITNYTAEVFEYILHETRRGRPQIQKQEILKHLNRPQSEFAKVFKSRDGKKVKEAFLKDEGRQHELISLKLPLESFSEDPSLD